MNAKFSQNATPYPDILRVLSGMNGETKTHFGEGTELK